MPITVNDKIDPFPIRTACFFHFQHQNVHTRRHEGFGHSSSRDGTYRILPGIQEPT